ncbi:hypothetical protein Taro_002916 [Colocasia esculenta]|uniref:Uncharacterized protein n=1 Tax=Colocasia esculenta TaxID=4460 RepID=A0A843TMA3_COLES|nr:hypothetical protein [Colocasia esculenta]
MGDHPDGHSPAVGKAGWNNDTERKKVALMRACVEKEDPASKVKQLYAYLALPMDSAAGQDEDRSETHNYQARKKTDRNKPIHKGNTQM